MQFKTWIEAYEDWEGWKHISKVPFVKINYKPYHQDPLGIYLFPADFNPIAIWKRFPYEMDVEVAKDIRVLDFSRLSPQECIQLVRKLGIKGESAYEDEIIENKYGGYRRSMWEWMRQGFQFNNAKMNGAFRKAGYDAIFDDTKSIHSYERQLLVLDPTKIRVKKVKVKKGSGYKELVQVVDEMKSTLSQFGEVKADKPKKGQYSGWDKQSKIQTRVVVEKGERYVSWEVSTYNHNTDITERPDKISVRYSWSKPSLNADYSIGAGVEIDDMDMSEVIDVITKTTQKVWDK